MDPNISYVTLGVTDFEASLAFYRDGLGFPVEDRVDDWVAFDLGGVRLALYPLDALAEDATVSAERGEFAGVTLANNVASETAVDDGVAAAADAGATVVKEPRETDWGGYSGYFADPDGYLWEVAYAPGYEVD